MATPRRLPSKTHRVKVEDALIKRREKQFQYEQLWDGRKQYYENFDKKNSKYEEWTSPRYHEEHSKLIEKIKNQREREEMLEKRRDKLRELLSEEEKLYRVEVMIYKTRRDAAARLRDDDIPTEVLKEVNNGFRVEEDDRRRHQAEINLYHQWRSSNPVLKHYERMHKGRELKLSWLDQQIENRMNKEREEEQCRRILKEREKMIKEEELKEKQYQKELQLKREQLQADLALQVEELRKKQSDNDKLRQKEAQDELEKNKLQELIESQIETDKMKSRLECDLYNIKHYKLKLKKRAEIVENELKYQSDLIKKLRDLEICDKIENDAKKSEIKEAIAQILVLNEEQKALEKSRQRYLDFLFDSEAKYQYEQQCEQWKQEELARSCLIKEVFDTVKAQIELNIEKNREAQKKVLKEREELINKIEQYDNELKKLKQEEETRRVEYYKRIKDDIKLKQLKKKEQENSELRKIDQELERVKLEEERIKREILNIQRKQGPIKPPRSKLFL